MAQKKLNEILVSKQSFESKEPYDLVYSNVTVINLLREERYFYDFIPDESWESYYVDYYVSQVKNGGFSQFVFNTRWNEFINKPIIDGLKKMGAKKHLSYFRKRLRLVKKMDKKSLEDFLQSDYFGENKTRDFLNDDSFYKIDEDLIFLNNEFLRNQPNLKILTIDEMFDYLEKILGKKVKRV